MHRTIWLSALLTAWLLPTDSAAQILRGRVMADTLPVSAAEVIVTDSAGTMQRLVTDSQGLFAVVLPAPGNYTVQVRHGGFGPVAPQPVRIDAYEDVTVELRLSAAIPLSPIEVTARRRYARGALRESVEERLAWAERTGLGQVLRRAEIDNTPVLAVQDLLVKMPRVRVIRTDTAGQRVWFGGAVSACMPQVYVDGVRDVTRQGILDELVPGDIEAVEVYRSALQAPPEFPDPGACGVILLWTRRDLAGGKRWTWKRALALGGVVGFMLLLIR